VEPWTADNPPSEGPDLTELNRIWQSIGSPAPVEAIYGKFTATKPGAHVDVLVNQPKPTGAPDLPAADKVFQYVTLSLVNMTAADVSATHVTISVDRTWLQANNVHPWGVKFQRYDPDKRTWTPLIAKRLRQDSAKVYYTVQPGGFSTWAITGSSQPPPPPFAISNLVLSAKTVSAGQPVTVTVDVRNNEIEARDYNAALFLNDRLAASRLVTVAGGTTAKVAFDVRPPQGSYNVRFDRLLDSFQVTQAQATAVPATFTPTATAAPATPTPLATRTPTPVGPTATPAPTPSPAPTATRAPTPVAPTPTPAPTTTTVPPTATSTNTPVPVATATPVPPPPPAGGTSPLVIILALAGAAAIGAGVYFAFMRRGR
jgi:PGF-pre-PGF domain-containing protein